MKSTLNSYLSHIHIHKHKAKEYKKLIRNISNYYYIF